MKLLFNSIFTILLQFAYAYLGYKINLSYEYSSSFEFIIGIAVTTLLMNILDHFFTLIAYDFVGHLSKKERYDKSKRKVAHWFIRVILYIIVYIISMTPLCSILITPLVQFCTKKFMEYGNNFLNCISNELTNSLVD